MAEIFIKYKFPETAVPLAPIDGTKSDWIDLRSALDYDLRKGDFKLIDLGVAMAIPEGYEAHIAPRGSTFKNFGLIQTNSVGIVDNSYRGPEDWWFMPVYATRDVHISAGDRICQFRIMRTQPYINFTPSTLEGNANRGSHGSTGIK